MNLITFILLLVTFPYWFPVVALPAIAIGLLWMIGYPIACTVHCMPIRLTPTHTHASILSLKRGERR